MYGAGDNQLAEDADDSLFSRIMYSERYVLQHLLPDINSHRYSLQPRRHNFALVTKTDDQNFIVRQVICTFLQTFVNLLLHTSAMTNTLYCFCFAAYIVLSHLLFD